MESKKYFDEHKESTKAELHKISSKEDLSDKQKKVLTDLLLDEVKENQGTEEFKNHAEIRKADYKKIRELIIERVGDAKKVTKEDIQEAVDFFYGKTEKKESKETISTLPWAVAKQETDAIKYFEENKEPKNLKIVEGIQKMREENKVTYKELWEGKYEVTMPFGNKKITMQFPPDTTLNDKKWSYTHFNGEEITHQETSRWVLSSGKWIKHLEEKEKQWQTLLSESEFKQLIQGLCPGWTEDEQILAFMMATWFYWRMWLKDQRAVECFRLSDDRYFSSMDIDDYNCSLVHSNFVE